jgi:hypothetical protein
MKIVKALLILTLTLFWGALSLILYSHSNSNFSIAVVTFIYGLLVYIVWPIGTPYSDVAVKRLFIGLGAGVFLVALNVLLNNECPNYPTYLVIEFPKQRTFVGAILLTCHYFGKYPTSLLLTGLGCYFAYLGYTLKILANPIFGNVRKVEISNSRKAETR